MQSSNPHLFMSPPDGLSDLGPIGLEEPKDDQSVQSQVTHLNAVRVKLHPNQFQAA